MTEQQTEKKEETPDDRGPKNPPKALCFSVPGPFPHRGFWQKGFFFDRRSRQGDLSLSTPGLAGPSPGFKSLKVN